MAQTINRLLAALLTFATLQVLANGKAELTLRIVPDLSTQLSNGQKICSGEIYTQEMHTGYQVWLDASTSGGGSNRYVLTGKSNPQHVLHVLIKSDGVEGGINGYKGIIKKTSEPRAFFEIVSDGAQDAPADEYIIVMHGIYLGT